MLYVVWDLKSQSVAYALHRIKNLAECLYLFQLTLLNFILLSCLQYQTLEVSSIDCPRFFVSRYENLNSAKSHQRKPRPRLPSSWETRRAQYQVQDCHLGNPPLAGELIAALDGHRYAPLPWIPRIPATRLAAVEHYLYNKLDAQASAAVNCARMWHKADVLQRGVAPRLKPSVMTCVCAWTRTWRRFCVAVA